MLIDCKLEPAGVLATATVRASCVVHPSLRPALYPARFGIPPPLQDVNPKGPKLFPARWLVKLELLRASYDTELCRLKLARPARRWDVPAARMFAQGPSPWSLGQALDYMQGSVGLLLYAAPASQLPVNRSCHDRLSAFVKLTPDARHLTTTHAVP